MSFIKQILKPFIEFDADQNVQTKVTAPVRPISENSKVEKPAEEVHHPLVPDEGAKPVVIKHSPPSTRLPLPEHVSYFENLIDKANRDNPIFTGADFKEFVDAKIDIDDIVDEKLKYQTAFNIFKNSGLTQDKLASTAQEYIDLIGRDLNAFQAAQSQKRKQQLQQKESDLKSKLEELQQLTQRTITLKNEINLISEEITTTQEGLNLIKNSFLMAGEKKQQEIQSELEKIEKHFER